jgi:hypothetical protein
MRVPDEEMITYPHWTWARDDMIGHGWTGHTLPSTDGFYAFDFIANHPTCGASPLHLTADTSRSGGPRWWWADYTPYHPSLFRRAEGGTQKGTETSQLRRRHSHRQPTLNHNTEITS